MTGKIPNCKTIIPSDPDAVDSTCFNLLNTLGAVFLETFQELALKVDSIASSIVPELVPEFAAMTITSPQNRTITPTTSTQNGQTIKIPPKSNLSAQSLAQIISRRKQATEIVLDGNRLTLDHIKALTQLSKVCSVSLVNCGLSDSDLLPLEEMQTIHTLDVSCNRAIVGTYFSKLPKSLVSFSAAYCMLSDGALASFKHMPHLASLMLSGNEGVLGETLRHLPQSLRELYLDCCSLQDRRIALLMYHNNLKRLSVTNNQGVTGKHFHYLESLETLNCSGCPITRLDYPKDSSVQFPDRPKSLKGVRRTTSVYRSHSALQARRRRERLPYYRGLPPLKRIVFKDIPKKTN